MVWAWLQPLTVWSLRQSRADSLQVFGNLTNPWVFLGLATLLVGGGLLSKVLENRKLEIPLKSFKETAETFAGTHKNFTEVLDRLVTRLDKLANTQEAATKSLQRLEREL